MSVEVRPAEVSDAATIARVHIDAWRAAYRGLLPERILAGLRQSEREKRWRKWLGPGTDGADTLVARLAGEVEGFVTIQIPPRDPGEAEDVGEIPALYVTPDRWRGGLGTALVTAALERMRQAGCREAMLWMLGGNDAAARFYGRTGWADDGGRRPSQYFPDLSELVEVRFRRPL